MKMHGHKLDLLNHHIRIYGRHLFASILSIKSLSAVFASLCPALPFHSPRWAARDALDSIMHSSERTRSARPHRPAPSCKFQSGRNLIVRLQQHKQHRSERCDLTLNF